MISQLVAFDQVCSVSMRALVDEPQIKSAISCFLQEPSCHHCTSGHNLPGQSWTVLGENIEAFSLPSAPTAPSSTVKAN